MSRIKPVEIKEGDTLSSLDINANQSELRAFTVDEENVRMEGISQSHVPSNAIHSATTAFSTQDSSQAAIAIASGWGTSASEWLVFSGIGNKISPLTGTATLNGSKGEMMIVRASCRVRMADFGSRTFNFSAPPKLLVTLRYALSDTPTWPGTWFDAEGTEQQFSIAFSGKIPSTQIPFADTPGLGSALSGEAGESWRNTSLSSIGSDDATEPSGADFNPIGARGLPFDHDFSYQTTWVYDPGTDVSAVSFGLWGRAIMQSSIEWPPSSFRGTRGKKGCSTVNYKGFYISDLQLTSTIIKR